MLYEIIKELIKYYFEENIFKWNRLSFILTGFDREYNDYLLEFIIPTLILP